MAFPSTSTLRGNHACAMIMKKHIDKGGEGLSPLFLEAMADYFKGPKSPASKAASGKPAASSAH